MNLLLLHTHIVILHNLMAPPNLRLPLALGLTLSPLISYTQTNPSPSLPDISHLLPHFTHREWLLSLIRSFLLHHINYYTYICLHIRLNAHHIFWILYGQTQLYQQVQSLMSGVNNNHMFLLARYLIIKGSLSFLSLSLINDIFLGTICFW